MSTASYTGDDISIFEWPNGCEVSSNKGNASILIMSREDAEALHESLGRYLKIKKTILFTKEKL